MIPMSFLPFGFQSLSCPWEGLAHQDVNYSILVLALTDAIIRVQMVTREASTLSILSFISGRLSTHPKSQYQR